MSTLSKILESRRDFVSKQLGEVCLENEKPRILSVSNGALREAETAIGLCASTGGTFVVLDGTGEPPDVFQLGYPRKSVQYISYPYGAIPGRENIGEFDFVYALNLLNEFDERRAKRLIKDLLAVLRPGGRLLLTNFTPQVPSSEVACFHRREEEMAELVPDSLQHNLLGHAIWRDEYRAVLYLEVQKGGSMSCSRTPGFRFLHQENQWYQ